MGTNCTCSERVKHNNEGENPESMKSVRNKAPMFFEEVSFDIKHSEDYDQYVFSKKNSNGTQPSNVSLSR